jgi:hypothetical protein
MRLFNQLKPLFPPMSSNSIVYQDVKDIVADLSSDGWKYPAILKQLQTIQVEYNAIANHSGSQHNHITILDPRISMLYYDYEIQVPPPNYLS